MEALYLLVPLSVLLVFAAMVVFFVMSDGGQFDDMCGPSMRLLHDDDSTVLPPVAAPVSHPINNTIDDAAE